MQTYTRPAKLALRALAAAVFLLAAGCGSLNLSGPVPSHVVPTGKGLYAGIAWLPGGWIVAAFNPQPYALGMVPHLVKLQPDGSLFQPIEVPPANTACLWIAQLEPTALPNGSIGFLSQCSLPGGQSPPEVRLNSYNLQTKQSSPLVAGPLLPNPGPFTWNPSMDKGLLGGPNDPCVSIVGISPAGMAYLPIIVSDEHRSWRLDELFQRPSTSVCKDLGNANWPAWSPDGRTIAFFASPSAVGLDGTARLDSPWNLYFMDSSEQRPRQELNGVLGPQDLKWSPDSRWLAFGGAVGGKAGTWLFEPTSRRLVRVSSSVMEALAWSPDGRQIAAVFHSDATMRLLEAGLLILNVAGLTSGPQPK
jgi:WD40 repeat protein